MRENLSLKVCKIKSTDQTAHLCSLISVFIIPFLESIMSKLATSKISVADETGLSLTLLEPRRQVLFCCHPYDKHTLREFAGGV